MTRRYRPFYGLQRLAALCGTLVAVACATTAPKLTPPTPPAVSIPIAPPAKPTSGDPKFDAFLERARITALGQGITAATFESATAGLRPTASIAAMNANQPEFSKSVWAYLDSAVSARRVKDATLMLARYGDVLARIEASSGVPKEILVAVWGIETDYGADNGSINIFAALATLAYDGSRVDYARPEFFAALKIYQDQHYALSQMTASWAGAFGQTQVTPTTFLKYAADGDGDGQIALASAARLLADKGWQKGQPWGFEVKLPANFSYEDADTDTQKPLNEWRAHGVNMVSGAALPSGADSTAIYLPAGAHGPAFLLFPNFSVILKYNNAASYALAVALLADRMAGGDDVKHAWPRGERALSRNERISFQADLNKTGFDSGTPDGVLGRKTRSALRQYQKAHGLAADGFPTAALLDGLEQDAAR